MHTYWYLRCSPHYQLMSGEKVKRNWSLFPLPLFFPCLPFYCLLHSKHTCLASESSVELLEPQGEVVSGSFAPPNLWSTSRHCQPPCCILATWSALQAIVCNCDLCILMVGNSLTLLLQTAPYWEKTNDVEDPVHHVTTEDTWKRYVFFKKNVKYCCSVIHTFLKLV